MSKVKVHLLEGILMVLTKIRKTNKKKPYRSRSEATIYKDGIEIDCIPGSTSGHIRKVARQKYDAPLQFRFDGRA